MTQQGANNVRDALLEQWRSQSSWQRFLLPGDFYDYVSTVSAEGFYCHMTTQEYLTMSDRVEVKTMKNSQSTRYSTDLNYRPTEFKDKTFRILSGESDVLCTLCIGARRVSCDSCSGNGKFDCPETMNCPECGGKGRREEACRNCRGTGRVPRMVQGRYGRMQQGQTSCSSCRGRGKP